jgi:hypothetical protein
MGDGEVVLHDLAIREEDGDHIVGRVATGVFVAVPAVGVRVIELLRQGLSVAETRERIAGAGTEVDVDAFVADLRECGFVVEPGAAASPRPPAEAAAPPRPLAVLPACRRRVAGHRPRRRRHADRAPGPPARER